MALSRSARKASAKSGLGNPDYILTIVIALLIIFGLIMISSASVVLGRNDAGNPNYYFFTQLKWVAIGVVILIAGYKIDYRFWRKIAPILMLLTIIVLIAVFLPGIGINRNGASRWVNLGFTAFQPSELAKLSLIVYLSAWFENKGNEVKKWTTSTIPFVLIILVIGGLVMKQPDMGTTVILSLVAGVMYIVAGARMSHIFIMAGLAISLGWYLIKTSAYRMSRFMIFLNPESDSSGQGYHVNQALLAIGSGGLAGLGFGKSRQKFSYLPEAATDSIFAVISEELGIIGAGFTITLITIFGYRGYKIAREAPDVFARLMAVGITTWIVGQSLINIMAILSMMPLTGVPLPFISYGGSSIVMLMLACGILLNISKHTQKGEASAHNSLWWRNWWTYIPGFGSSQ
ncbi:MAG: putative lipid II flippase FtsW [Patescibacteria group bacterium]|nr:putative lipid II flippase FtsW [Patescibacteria group bacterium]